MTRANTPPKLSAKIAAKRLTTPQPSRTVPLVMGWAGFSVALFLAVLLLLEHEPASDQLALRSIQGSEGLILADKAVETAPTFGTISSRSQDGVQANRSTTVEGRDLGGAAEVLIARTDNELASPGNRPAREDVLVTGSIHPASSETPLADNARLLQGSFRQEAAGSPLFDRMTTTEQTLERLETAMSKVGGRLVALEAEVRETSSQIQGINKHFADKFSKVEVTVQELEAQFMARAEASAKAKFETQAALEAAADEAAKRYFSKFARDFDRDDPAKDKTEAEAAKQLFATLPKQRKFIHDPLPIPAAKRAMKPKASPRLAAASAKVMETQSKRRKASAKTSTGAGLDLSTIIIPGPEGKLNSGKPRVEPLVTGSLTNRERPKQAVLSTTQQRTRQAVHASLSRHIKPRTRTLSSRQSLRPTPSDLQLAIDLGRVANLDGVRRKWRELTRQEEKAIGGLLPAVTVVEISQTGPELRMLAGPIATSEQVARICAKLAKRGQDCRPALFEGTRVTLQ